VEEVGYLMWLGRNMIYVLVYNLLEGGWLVV
jgi:hypothetical protein